MYCITTHFVSGNQAIPSTTSQAKDWTTSTGTMQQGKKQGKEHSIKYSYIFDLFRT
jgi:hypothetical protein